MMTTVLSKFNKDEINSGENLKHGQTIFAGPGTSAQIGNLYGDAYISTTFNSPPPKPIRFVFSDPDPYFTGRLRELDDLLDWTINPKKLHHRKKPIVVVSGLGGVGKTQLILKFIHQNYDFYKNNIIWINAQNINKIKQQIVTLASRLKIPLRIDGQEKDFDSLIGEVFGELSTSPTLFVLDDVNREEDIKSFLSGGTAGVLRHFIITSRISKTFSDGIHHLKLSVFDSDDAQKYVLDKLNDANDLRCDITRLVEVVQRFPLALKQATAYINRHRVRGPFHINDYIREFNTCKKKILGYHLDEDILNEYKLTTLTTWQVTIDSIEKCEAEGHLAIRILRIIAYFDPDHIRRDIFYNLKSSSNAQILDVNEVISAVELLVNYSMIDSRDQQSILIVHRLVQQVMIIRSEEVNGLEKRILEDGLCLILEKNEDEESHEELHEHGISVFVASLKFDELVHQFSTFPAMILDSLYNSEKYYRALHFGDQILPTLTNILGDEHPDTLESRFFTAESYQILGKYHEAHRMHKEIYEKRKVVLGEDHVHTLASMTSVAFSYHYLGKHNEGLQLNETVLKKLQAKFGDSNAVTLQSMSAVAISLCAMGDYSKAEQMQTEIYEKRLDKFGENDSETLDSRSDIARTKMISQQNADAMKMFENLYEKQKTFLGNDDAGTLDTKRCIAILKAYKHNHSDALQMTQEIFETQKRTFGEHDPRTLKSRMDVIFVKSCGRKYSEVLETYPEVLEKQKSIMGYDHTNTLFIQSIAAHSYTCQGKHNEALQIYEKILENIKRIFGEDHAQTLQIKFKIACSYKGLGRYNDAMRLHTEIFEKRKIVLGESDRNTLNSEFKIAELYCKMKEHSEHSLRLLQEVFEKLKSILGENDRDSFISEATIAELLCKLGRHSEALEMHERVFEKQKAKFGENDRNTLVSMSNIALSQRYLGKHSLALKSYKKVFEKRQLTFGDDDRDTLAAKFHIADILFCLGEHSEALRIQQEVLEKQKTTLGDDHLDTILSKSNLGDLHFVLGNHSEAFEMHKEVFEQRKLILGENNLDTITSQFNLAESYLALGERSQARQIHEDVFEERKLILGKDHEDTIHSKDAVFRSQNFLLWKLKKILLPETTFEMFLVAIIFAAYFYLVLSFFYPISFAWMMRDEL